MSNDPLTGFSEVDPVVRGAVAAIDRGDVRALEELLARHPRLVRERVECGAGYFANPYLLWFVAGNPVRIERLPRNAAEVAKAIIAFARTSDVDSLQEQMDYTLSLVCSGRVSRESGVQLELLDALVEAGADPDGALDPALAHREEEAVRCRAGRSAAVPSCWPLAKPSAPPSRMWSSRSWTFGSTGMRWK